MRKLMAEGVSEKEANKAKSSSNKEGPTRRRRSKPRGVQPGSVAKHQVRAVELKPLPGEPRILPRDEHCISRKNIDPECLKVMGRLIRYGHRSFLVGGGVRDLLLGRTPKDFDVSTDASPEEVRKLFRNSRIIGRRFKLNHVFFKGGKTIEVSTFRQDSQDEEGDVQTLARDNTFGDPHTDALRRDLTINGLFYDLSSFSVVDYIGGIDDLNNEIVRVIGEPAVRFKEDPIRMIRAVRHAARTGFTIEKQTYDAICENTELIALCPKARVFEEFQREVCGGYATASFKLLMETNLLEQVFEILHSAIKTQKSQKLFFKRLERIDDKILSGLTPRLGLVFGALFFDLLAEKTLPKNDVLSQYWRTAPDFNQELSSANLPTSSSPSRRKSSPLLLFIDSVFDNVGLPRKERERLERALVTRLSLFEYDPDDSFGRKLKKTKSFEDALTLSELLDVEDSQAELLARWRKSTKAKSSEKRSRKRPQRRRKSPRRKTSQKGNSDE